MAERLQFSEREALLRSLGQAHVHGVGVDWAAVLSAGRRVALPSYAFQRRRYWLAGRGSADVSAVGLQDADHPLLGAAVALGDGRGWVLSGRWSLATQGWLADHVVLGTVVVPGTAFVELALAAGRQVGCPLYSSIDVRPDVRPAECRSAPGTC